MAHLSQPYLFGALPMAGSAQEAPVERQRLFLSGGRHEAKINIRRHWVEDSLSRQGLLPPAAL